MRRQDASGKAPRVRAYQVIRVVNGALADIGGGLSRFSHTGSCKPCIPPSFDPSFVAGGRGFVHWLHPSRPGLTHPPLCEGGNLEFCGNPCPHRIQGPQLDAWECGSFQPGVIVLFCCGSTGHLKDFQRHDPPVCMSTHMSVYAFCSRRSAVFDADPLVPNSFPPGAVGFCVMIDIAHAM